MEILKSSSAGMTRAKVVLLGAPSVGKTSLVQQYVHSMFSETHKSTLGVKVDRKSVAIDDRTVNLLIWDMHGETDGLDVPANYLTGAAAALVVFDSTRPETIGTALALSSRLRDASPDANVLYVANKADLDFDSAALAAQLGSHSMHQTSAKNDEGVEELFAEIASSL